MKAFVPPHFDERSLEVRCSDDEVAIYGTVEGITKLISLLEELRDKMPCHSSHLHVEDYEILTQESLRLTLVLFENSDPTPQKR